MTQRTKAELDEILADNHIRAISPADLRDFLESAQHSHGSLSVTAPAATTIGVAGTYVKAAGTTGLGAGAHRVSMPANNRLQYDGAAAVHARVAAHLTLTCAGNNQLVGVAIAVNGVVVAASEIEHKMLTGADAVAVSLRADLSLSPTDYAELWVTNKTSTSSVTVQKASVYLDGILA